MSKFLLACSIFLLSTIFGGILYSQALDSHASEQPFIHPGVLSALQREDQVFVIITLDESVIPHLEEGLEVRKKTVAKLQERVVSVLKEDEFTLRYRCQVVAALYGVISISGLEKLMDFPFISGIFPDAKGEGNLAQSVPLIQANEVHNLGFTGANVVVGVLDSGIDTDHPDLADAITYQYHFLNQGSNSGPGAEDDNGHGTNVSGIVTSNGTVAFKGVAPEAKIVAIKVLDSNNSGWVSDWTAGIDHILANNTTLQVKVINMSLGTFALFNGNCDTAFPAFTNAILLAKSAGITIFSSSGNNGSLNSTGAPTCISGSVGIGAIYDSNLGREPDSGTYQTLFGGSWPACFDDPTSPQVITCFTNRDQLELELLAPGTRLTSTGIGGGMSTYIGTSQASPHAAGIAALLLENMPTLTPDDIVWILKQTASPIFDSATGWSFPSINALRAFSSLNAPVVVNPIPDTTINTHNQNLFMAHLNDVFFYAGGTTLSFSVNSSGNVTGAISGDSLYISPSAGFLGKDTLYVTADNGSGSMTTDDFVVTVVPSLGIEDDDSQNPLNFQLYQNYPNPFNPATVISYRLATAADVQLRIYNLLGEQIRTLVNQKQAPGVYQVQWDGKNDNGKPLASGIYLYRLQTGSFIQTRKMIFLK